MFNIKFTCKALTGSKVHSIAIDDSSLEDTWDCIDVGEVKGNDYITTARAKVGNTHDVNVFTDGETDEIKLSLYTFEEDSLDDEYIQTDTSDWTNCEIIEILDDDGKQVEVGNDDERADCDDCGGFILNN